MAVWYNLWSFGIFFTFWFVWTTKNLATLIWSTLSYVEVDLQHLSLIACSKQQCVRFRICM
jgi:hypothetical protein